MENKIIDFLRKKDGYISGEELGHRLGISRQGLWKHIQELKESGYEIEAVPHLGYHLISSPDRLFAQEISRHLGTRFIGKKIYYFDEVSSTMDVAMQLALKGAVEGTVVLSELQTKGRGRFGRNWFSPRYKGIYFSLILKPAISPNQAAVLTLLSAVSICQAIRQITGVEAQIKWPNDILIQQKKVAGILTEIQAEMDEIHCVIVGVGINVNNEKKSLISQATSLKEHIGGVVNRVELLQAIFNALEKNYLHFQEKGSRFIIQQWREYSVTLGRRVKIYSHREHVEGEAIDIDADGALLLRNDAGLTQKILSGDVVHCR